MGKEAWKDSWLKSFDNNQLDNALVCMKTGWSKRFNDESKYRNFDDKNVMHFPGFAKEAAEFLVTQRKIHGIAIGKLFQKFKVIL